MRRPTFREAAELGRCAAVVALLCVGVLLGCTVRARADQTWLVVSDIHLDPYAHGVRPSTFGHDSNLALFHSTLIAMRRADPNPALVVIAGDLFAHHFRTLARLHAPNVSAQVAGERTMRLMAGAFAATFPHAAFALVPGNNDNPCGDYRSDLGGAYNAAVARIWAPLVDRHGAAPRFVRAYAANGSYTARLPGLDLRLVAVNSIFLSARYRGGCIAAQPRAGERELAWLSATLRRAPRGERNVVLMHIPPGFDAFASEFTRSLNAWPMLATPANKALLALLESPADRVAFAVAGHTHRLDFRLAAGVPIFVLGAISPIYDNNPNFATLRVDGDGIRDATLFAYDTSGGRWLPGRDFDATWNSARIDAASLRTIHRRLAVDLTARHAWDEQSSGRPAHLAPLWAAQWRVAWCAQTELASGFARCARIGVARRRLLWSVVGAGVVLALVVLGGVVVVRRRRRMVS